MQSKIIFLFEKLFNRVKILYIMTQEEKTMQLKKLEALVLFQKDCLNGEDWDDYDKAEDEIKRLEKEIINIEEKE